MEAPGFCRSPKHNLKRWVSALVSSHRSLFAVLWIAVFASVFLWQGIFPGGPVFRWRGDGNVGSVPGLPIPKLRDIVFNITDFGAVGDGVTVNTEAFERAVAIIEKLGRRGGGQLNVPPGRRSHVFPFFGESNAYNVAGVSIGSEMSGGVSNVTVENLLVWDSRRAVRIKTAPGRGGYVRDINYRNLTFHNVRVGIVIKTDYNEHPDEGYDPKALPMIEGITFTGVHGQGVRVPVRMHGSEEIPVRNVTFWDMSVGTTYKKKHVFQCAFVHGRVIGSVFPAPCDNLDRYDEGGNLVSESASQNVTDIDYDI
ncbi:hypothetical protein SAY86_003054 [Trapa natans]|uniref:Polygalacturonase n=1 Tax=Trapa natans TaxID=22666 RepID=A0AAN7R323_TRANT|nr:hypothetical protein SAY86_003054 [Trapa natans]